MATENALQTIKSKHEMICLELNMDSETSRVSWENYEQQAGADNLLEVSTRNSFKCHNEQRPLIS